MIFSTRLVVFGAEYLIALLVIVTASVVWVHRKTLTRQFWIYSVGVGAASFVLSRIAGRLFDNPRPFVVGHFVPLVPHAPDNGFPSDHTLLAAWLAVVVYRLHRPTGMAFMVGAVLVGLSRVAAGVHHPIDIVGSLVIVGIVAGLVALVQRRSK